MVRERSEGEHSRVPELEAVAWLGADKSSSGQSDTIPSA